MRDPARRDDPLDRLKFLPVDEDGDVYLTLSGEGAAASQSDDQSGPPRRAAAAAGHQPAGRRGRSPSGPHLRLGPGKSRMAAFRAQPGRAGGFCCATISSSSNISPSDRRAGQRGDRRALWAAGIHRRGPTCWSRGDNNTIRYTLNGIRAWARSSWLRVDLFDLRPTAYGDLGAGRRRQ